MADVFAEATQKLLEDKGLTESSSPETNTRDADQVSTEQAPSLDTKSSTQEQQIQEAIYELKENGKFKFGGKEYTAEDIKRMQQGEMRLSDYTKKTQSLAEERKSFEAEKKYNDNLYYDLEAVRENPSLANKFVEVYPAKFHSYLKDVLSRTQQQDLAQQQTQTHQRSQPDVELLTKFGSLNEKVSKLEKFHLDQEAGKVQLEIEQKISTLSKKYPDALRKMVLSDAYETHSKGVKMTDDVWEEIFKTNDQAMKDLVKTKYGNLVKKQAEANNKAKDVDAGGGTVGKAPPKFKRIEDVGKFAEEQMSNRR